MLLGKAGFTVQEADSLRNAVTLIKSDQVDLLLICHTVPANEQDELIRAVHTLRRLLPTLCINAYDGAAQKECINVENSPVSLIEAIRVAARAA